MSKMKKIIMSTIIGVMALLGFCSTANAYSVGQELTITWSQYKTSNVYCIEHKQKLSGVQTYTIASQVRIEGNKSTDHTKKSMTSWYNAKLAYILTSNNGTDTGTGTVANAVWNNMYKWMEEVGQHHAGLYVGFASDKTGSPTPIDAEAENYANNYANVETQKITDNTNKDKIKVVSFTKDKETYMRIGPFNWTFSGSASGITALDKDNKTINNITYSTFNGDQEQIYSGPHEIQSGQNFYISVPINTKVEKLRLTGKAKTNVRSVNIWFLKSHAENKQNLIITEPYQAPLEITTDFDYNIETKGNLTVIKVDQNDRKIKLGGVGFIIQHKETGKYVHKNKNGKITYVDKDKATEFVTAKKGKNKGKFTIKNLMVGTYAAYETKNPNYGYEIVKNGKEKEIVVDKTSKLIVENKQKYIKLSGFVWVDRASGKDQVRNNLSQSVVNDDKDMLFNGITVRVKLQETGEIAKDKDGNKLETVTAKLNRYKKEGNNGNGEYLFKGVLVDNLADYYIEFEYDGLTYTNVLPYNQVKGKDVDGKTNITAEMKKKRGSKAAELANKKEVTGEFIRKELSREEFNQNFSVVEGKSKDTGYTRDANGNIKHNLSYNIKTEGDTQTATLIHDKQYMITATTEETKYSIQNNYVAGEPEIKYINLGLWERDQPQTQIRKDLHNIKLSLNGKGHTYLYANRHVNAGAYEGKLNVGVEMGEKSGRLPYTRPIYKADVDFESEDKSKELKVYVTYQITIEDGNSNDSGLEVQVNNIAEYYDNKYKLTKVGKALDETGTVKEEVKHTEPTKIGDTGYTKTIIETNAKVRKGKEATYFVEFALDRDAVLNILNNKENLNNEVEINSYSVYKDNKIYAGIDRLSNPGNHTPGSKVKEADTDACPALQLTVTDAREVTGKVFVDSVPEVENKFDPTKINAGQIRVGSGEYEEGEIGIGEVEVTLRENAGGSGKVYKTTTVKENGKYGVLRKENQEEGNDNKYELEKFQEGKEYDRTVELQKGDFFICGYIPGNYTITYTWGNETYTVQNYKGTIYKEKERQNDVKWYKQENPRLNDAMDNYDQRIAIDKELENITNGSKTTINTMESNTPSMEIDIEYESTITHSLEDKYTYRISNIDFGIVERAKQDIELNKRVKKLTFTLHDGRTIANVEIKEDENGNREVVGDQKFITYMGPNINMKPSNGFIRIEVDNELIKGSTLAVEYEIKVKNRSEVDYIDKNFYHYGEIPSEAERQEKVVKVTPTSIVDYLDKEWSFKPEKIKEEGGWEVATLEDIKDKISEEVYNNEVLKNNEKHILCTDILKDEPLEPNKTSTPIKLSVEKKVDTSDEISLDNEAEILGLSKTGGAKLQSIPGNYIPAGDKCESDDSMAETVIVTAATGENRAYMLPVIIGATALLVLGAGIIIIKKKAI